MGSRNWVAIILCMILPVVEAIRFGWLLERLLANEQTMYFIVCRYYP